MIAEKLLAFTWILTEVISLGLQNEIINPRSQAAAVRITDSLLTLPAAKRLQNEYPIS